VPKGSRTTARGKLFQNRGSATPSTYAVTSALAHARSCASGRMRARLFVRLRALITRRLLARASCVRSIFFKGGKRVKRTGVIPIPAKKWLCFAPIPKEMAYFTPIPAKKKANFPDTSKKEGEFSRYQQKRRRISPIPA